MIAKEARETTLIKEAGFKWRGEPALIKVQSGV